ncbi:MAG: ATP-binding protein [Verrucomicrobiaceae bacterium]|nr:ATP-binding protein [Verrucomicrobiaceae bacterium]
MQAPRSEQELQALILEGIEENSRLDYKAADALQRTDGKKQEITKDVSAFANAAGGMIIFGIREHTKPDKRHLPESIDPIDHTQFSKEWLDQVIGGIQPRITGLEIIPIPVEQPRLGMVYVVVIPQGETAHQALDLRYYRRRNFERTAMEDYEIREVMNRICNPVLNASILVLAEFGHRNESRVVLKVKNESGIMAEHYCVTLKIPGRLSGGYYFSPEKGFFAIEEGLYFHELRIDNARSSPLFPHSEVTHSLKFSIPLTITPTPPPSNDEITITIFADQSPKVVLKKSLKAAELDWQ